MGGQCLCAWVILFSLGLYRCFLLLGALRVLVSILFELLCLCFLFVVLLFCGLLVF